MLTDKFSMRVNEMSEKPTREELLKTVEETRRAIGELHRDMHDLLARLEKHAR